VARRKPNLDELLKKLDYSFEKPELLDEALTHVSAPQAGGQSYQRLEFLGDRVLGLAIAELLFRTFPGAPEGELSRRLAALGAEPVSVHSTGALTDVFVVLPDESALRGLAPDLGQVKAINQRERNRGTIVTAPADSGFDFVSRFFAPAAGIPEDPVCGSAHTALAPYWAERLGRNELVGFQASARGGVVRVATVGDRVHLSGQAITTLDGDLLV